MNHLPPMILDLAMILGAAGVSTLIFSKLRQPVVLGYLIAGFAVGPYFPFWPTVVDNAGVHLWAEIGVIFLLFSLGLEFSFKKLAKVGKSAFIAALFEIITMSALGYLVGRALGWPTMDSIFLGAILSMSSTTIIIRAFDEAGLKGKAFAGLVFGILIVEDLMAILIMVILTSISTPGAFSGGNLAFLSARLVFFLMIWFIVGIYILPSLLKKVRTYLNDEILLVVSISLCFLMVVLATKANFSAALGAFIMGSILSETNEGERIEHLLVPVKNLFAAVFFVSVGMMINPMILKDHFGVVVLITLITIIGKLLGSGFGAALSGQSLKKSTQAGMSLAQIGEFSFIIASLGVSLNVVSDFLYPIVIAVSAVTTFTTPYMIRYSGPIYTWIESKLPGKFLERLSSYESAVTIPGRENLGKLIWNSYGAFLLLNAVVILAIGLGSAQFALPIVLDMFGNSVLVKVLACVATLTLCSPFLYALVLKTPKKIHISDSSTLVRMRSLQIGIFVVRFLLCLILVEVIVTRFSDSIILPLVILVVGLIVTLFSKNIISKIYFRFEDRFIENLNAKERAEIESATKLPKIVPWNATVSEFKLSSNSPIAGLTLIESHFRRNTGATVAMIVRGTKSIFAPSGNTRLLPNDEIFLIGTEDQLDTASKLIEVKQATSDMVPANTEVYTLDSFSIHKESALVGSTVQDIGRNDKYNCLIVGIERDGIRKINPESTASFNVGDIIWIFGHKDKIHEMKKVNHKS